MYPGRGGGISAGGAAGTIVDSIIADNVSGTGSALLILANLQITGCTFAGNKSPGVGGVFDIPAIFGNIDIRNSIIWGNIGTLVTLFNAPPTPLISFTISDSDVQSGYTGAGSNNFTADPMFVDAASGDYHIRGDSPCVGIGNPAAPNVGAKDVDGQPRVLYGGLDVGADEMGDASLDPAAAGNVGTTGGTPPEQVLLVGGGNGGVARRATFGVGQPFTISVARPSSNTGLARFAVYGLLREARYDDVITFPAGIGAMTFPPCILLSFLQPVLFTLTNNFPIGPCGQIISSTPAPWVSPPVNIPVPFTLTIQGLIEDTPGVVRTTNAVIIEVR